MKKTLAFVLCALFVCLALSACAEDFKVGMECDYAPFNWTQAEAGEYTCLLYTSPSPRDS